MSPAADKETDTDTRKEFHAAVDMTLAALEKWLTTQRDLAETPWRSSLMNWPRPTGEVTHHQAEWKREPQRSACPMQDGADMGETH